MSCSEAILFPFFELSNTKIFSVISFKGGDPNNFINEKVQAYIFLNINCNYTNSIISKAIKRRPWCKLVSSIDAIMSKPNQV